MSRKACLVPQDPAMPKTAQAKTVKAPADEDINRAVERVYQRYGPALSVFFRAVRGQDQPSQGHLELECEQRDKLRAVRP
jgi:hypothetical protein